MKTVITSNGVEFNITLEPENELEKAVVKSMNLFNQKTIITKSDGEVLSITTDTSNK
jgi:hypothetical protein